MTIIKSQGLPINFIVLIAIGVLVLILLMLFILPNFISGQAATSQTKATGECNSRCSVEMQYASSASGNVTFVDVYGTGGRQNAPYCSFVQTVAGIGSDLRCDQLVQCYVEDQENNKCKLKCSNSTAVCE